MAKQLIIAIDGPVASGKTTVGELTAKKLGYRFLDTGTGIPPASDIPSPVSASDPACVKT